MVQQLGHPVIIVSTFMSVVIAAGAHCCNGLLDICLTRFGRRLILVFASIGAALKRLVSLAICAVASLMHLLVGGGLFGAFAMQVYGLSAAHANDYAEPHEFVAISGGLLIDLRARLCCRAIYSIHCNGSKCRHLPCSPIRPWCISRLAACASYAMYNDGRAATQAE